MSIRYEEFQGDEFVLTQAIWDDYGQVWARSGDTLVFWKTELWCGTTYYLYDRKQA